MAPVRQPRTLLACLSETPSRSPRLPTGGSTSWILTGAESGGARGAAYPVWSMQHLKRCGSSASYVISETA